jgi:hypothetical protein
MAVAQGGRDALHALAHGGIRQADDAEAADIRRGAGVHLYLHAVAVNAVDRGGLQMRNNSPALLLFNDNL